MSDRKVIQSNGIYLADLVSSTDYYAFGMVMADRSFNTEGYRYGFNGKENDNEVKGTGNQQDYGKRIYDTRIGRFLSVDPLTKTYPFYTPYQFAGNDPINFIDIDGGEKGYSKQQMDALIWKAREDPNMYFTDNRKETAYKNLEANKWIYLATSVNGTRYFEKPLNGGKWEEFEPTDAKEEEKWTEINKNTMSHLQGTAQQLTAFGKKVEQSVYVAVIMGTGGAASSALGVGVLATELSVGSAAADLTIQLATNGGKFNEVNWTSVAANGILKNPFSAAFIGAAFQYSVKDGTTNSILGDKTGGQLLFETTLGTVGNVTASHLGQVPFLKELPRLNPKVAEQVDSYIWNGISNAATWSMQKATETKNSSNEKKDTNEQNKP